MKRIVGAGLVLVIVLALLAGCDHGSQLQTNAPQSQTSTGFGKNVWHWNVNFTTYATVTVEDNFLKQVTIDPDKGSYHTGSFSGWTMQIRDDFVKEFIGLSVEEVIKLKVLPAQDITDHYDGGLIEGAVDAVIGATASSVTIALAIQDAVSKIANMKE